MEDKEKTEKLLSAARWLKRFGIVGFLLFLVKGLLWLIIPALAVYFAR
ncbi:MAG: alanyl-tRNA synthetase [Acidobacteriota bacterium]|nr:alanyl-tRNA synthetase [Acidobacteriota bacterium]